MKMPILKRYISSTQRKKGASHEVILFNTETGELFQTNHVKMFCETFGLDVANVYRLFKGQQHTYKNFIIWPFEAPKMSVDYSL